MAEHPQGMDHREQLEHMRWISLLSVGQLTALVSNRVVMTLVVGLREHGRDGDLTGIGSDHRATARVESAEHRSRRQALF